LAACERIHYAPHAMPLALSAVLAASAAGTSSDSSAFLRQYLTVAIFAAAAVVMVGAMLGLGRLLRPSRPQEQKSIAYESGVDPVGQGWSQSQVRYYVFALLFVMFDVEAVFIFPWATRLEAMGTYGLVEMAIFIGILVLGLVYAWRKGVLRWV
jgi:NADH-quinone oxidoreductase subunit A